MQQTNGQNKRNSQIDDRERKREKNQKERKRWTKENVRM